MLGWNNCTDCVAIETTRDPPLIFTVEFDRKRMMDRLNHLAFFLPNICSTLKVGDVNSIRRRPFRTFLTLNCWTVAYKRLFCPLEYRMGYFVSPSRESCRPQLLWIVIAIGFSYWKQNKRTKKIKRIEKKWYRKDQRANEFIFRLLGLWEFL